MSIQRFYSSIICGNCGHHHANVPFSKVDKDYKCHECRHRIDMTDYNGIIYERGTEEGLDLLLETIEAP